MTTRPAALSRQEFDELFRCVCNWGRWGPDDHRGALNFITPERVLSAAALVVVPGNPVCSQNSGATEFNNFRGEGTEDAPSVTECYKG